VTLDTFAAAVVAYRRAVNGSITSWGRSPERNRDVGGHPRSAHLVDLGADCVPGPGFADVAREHIAAQHALRAIIEDDHDHLQPLDWTPAPPKEA
jgi:hypothetical protein